jgi:hypothetical protein
MARFGGLFFRLDFFRFGGIDASCLRGFSPCCDVVGDATRYTTPQKRPVVCVDLAHAVASCNCGDGAGKTKKT